MFLYLACLQKSHRKILPGVLILPERSDRAAIAKIRESGKLSQLRILTSRTVKLHDGDDKNSHQYRLQQSGETRSILILSTDQLGSKRVILRASLQAPPALK